ncbi:MAG: arginine N-succinyltransferase [Proteobacteria bacterium]|nr:arginine N-succinyltransferase [Pseudomonadota bacterium]NDC25847.1 arginine N-succinyltransferase [Pseudomonadota bacterium]NDD05626.1 arginine N-succinyltransferase [Pseudomonadota bacterium]NDG28152.1 arginine N-succinyltransferase [Pseudomonadota bacterium]
MTEFNFLVRSVREQDLDELERLSGLVYFINLPNNRDLLKEKIKKSVDSFKGTITDKFDREYIFVMEDLSNGKVIGTSMIIARHGSPDSPHMYFELKEKQKYSETIHAGFIHKVLSLKFESDGPTEIGGLVIDPSYRGHKLKLGRILSFSRFAFIKMKRRWFKDRVLSELMPPLSENGESLLWEALGRRFTNLSYQDADLLSRKNKEFITSLFPRGDIYTVLLSGEARDAIGKVGPDTEPVKHMLEKIGFKWKEHIDPFDGGPHFWADTDKITLVNQTKKYHLHRDTLKSRLAVRALASRFENGEFRCLQTPFELFRGKVLLPKTASELLELDGGADIYTLPLES